MSIHLQAAYKIDKQLVLSNFKSNSKELIKTLSIKYLSDFNEWKKSIGDFNIEKNIESIIMGKFDIGVNTKLLGLIYGKICDFFGIRVFSLSENDVCLNLYFELFPEDIQSTFSPLPKVDLFPLIIFENRFEIINSIEKLKNFKLDSLSKYFTNDELKNGKALFLKELEQAKDEKLDIIYFTQ